MNVLKWVQERCYEWKAQMLFMACSTCDCRSFLWSKCGIPMCPLKHFFFLLPQNPCMAAVVQPSPTHNTSCWPLGCVWKVWDITSGKRRQGCSLRCVGNAASVVVRDATLTWHPPQCFKAVEKSAWEDLILYSGICTYSFSSCIKCTRKRAPLMRVCLVKLPAMKTIHWSIAHVWAGSPFSFLGGQLGFPCLFWSNRAEGSFRLKCVFSSLLSLQVPSSLHENKYWRQRPLLRKHV